MSQGHNHLNHATWECKYHVVFTPKYRKKLLFGQFGRTWEPYSTNSPQISSWISCSSSSPPHKVPPLVPESFITAYGGSPPNPQLCWGLLARICLKQAREAKSAFVSDELTGVAKGYQVRAVTMNQGRFPDIGDEAAAS